MTRHDVAKAAFALTAAAAVSGLAIQVALALQAGGGPEAVATRFANLFSFFTIQSNVLVAATCALLVTSLDRPSPAFRALRLAGVLDIAVTGVVYHLLLAQDHTGWALVGDQLLHTVVPILAVGGWIAFGPRRMATPTDAAAAALVPAAWVVLTLVRGPLVDWYPYPFIDVVELGYGRVALNLVVIALLFVALAAAAVAGDRWLSRWRATGGQPG